MRIGLLGSVTAWRPTEPAGDPEPRGEPGIPLGGALLRGLLARLALDTGRTVTVDSLVDDLWGRAAPDGVGNALQSLVSRLRRALGADVVRTGGGGYRLTLPPESVDALEFATLAASARVASGDDPEHARRLLRRARDLWRGPALADVRDLPFAPAAAERLEEQRVLAVQLRARLALAAGDAIGELDELTAVLAEQPLGRASPRCSPGRCTRVAGRPKRWTCWPEPAPGSSRISAPIPVPSWPRPSSTCCAALRRRLPRSAGRPSSRASWAARRTCARSAPPWSSTGW